LQYASYTRLSLLSGVSCGSSLSVLLVVAIGLVLVVVVFRRASLARDRSAVWEGLRVFFVFVGFFSFL